MVKLRVQTFGIGKDRIDNMSNIALVLLFVFLINTLTQKQTNGWSYIS